MSILTKYITYELLVAIAIGIMLFAAVFIIQALFKGMDLFLLSEFSFITLFKMVAVILPPLLILILPIALLMAVISVYGRLSEEREIPAMLMAGMRYRKLLMPAFIIGIICTLFLLGWSEKVMPKSIQIQQAMVVKFIENISITGLLREGSFISKFENIILHVHKVNPVSNVLEKVTIFIHRQGKILGLIVAPEGVVDFEPENLSLKIHLSNGSIYEPLNNVDMGITKFDEFDFLIDVRRRLQKYYRQVELLEGLEREELKDLMKVQKEKNLLSIAGSPRWYDTAITLHQRSSFPFACLFMALVGVPVGLATHRGKKAWVFVLTLVIVFLYYSIFLIGKALIKSDFCSPMFGVWLPNYFLIVIAFVSNWMVSRR